MTQRKKNALHNTQIGIWFTDEQIKMIDKALDRDRKSANLVVKRNDFLRSIIMAGVTEKVAND